MAKLILTLDNAILGEFQLNKERTTIGRRSASDIHIDNLAISGEHAAILQVDHNFYLEDVGSTNGTRVNGKLIKKHLLQHADVITLGKHQLKYLNEAALSVTDNANVASTTKQSVSSDTSAASLREQAAIPVPVATANVAAATSDTEGSVAAIAKIKLLNGTNVGRELTINKALTTLGKVGTQVAVINKRPHGYFITHIEGKVFPIVNGHSIGAQAFELHHNDILELAGAEMVFYLSTPPNIPA